MLKVCILASQAFIATQTLTLPDGRVLMENVTIIQPCPVRPDQMNSVFHERAWRRVKKLRKWSKLG
jgi:hypothetical protein